MTIHQQARRIGVHSPRDGVYEVSLHLPGRGVLRLESANWDRLQDVAQWLLGDQTAQPSPPVWAEAVLRDVSWRRVELSVGGSVCDARVACDDCAAAAAGSLWSIGVLVAIACRLHDPATSPEEVAP